MGELKAEYCAPLGLLFPVAGVVTSIWLLANANVRNLVLGLGAMILIAPLYFLMKRAGKISNQ